jgi:phage baseplate assembly protein W
MTATVFGGIPDPAGAPAGRAAAAPAVRGAGASTITGLRFAHPDFDSIGGVGLLCSGTGRLERVSGADLLRQSLLILLSTFPGERVMRPDYGCELLTLAFARNDDTTAGLAIHYVRQAIDRFEPRVRILRVDATRSAEDPQRLDIVLEYQPRLGGGPESLNVGLMLDSATEEN